MDGEGTGVVLAGLIGAQHGLEEDLQKVKAELFLQNVEGGNAQAWVATVIQVWPLIKFFLFPFCKKNH